MLTLAVVACAVLPPTSYLNRRAHISNLRHQARRVLIRSGGLLEAHDLAAALRVDVFTLREALSGMPDTVLVTDTDDGRRMILLDTHTRHLVSSGA